MDDEAALATQAFEAHRSHLRAVAYRMLGSLSEADDAVQEAWLRLARSDTAEVQNMRGWLTTVVARVCLDMLRSRRARVEEPLDDVHLPDPIVTSMSSGPEEQAVVADSVGLALLVVLDTLSPSERLAFVLHDVFGVPFEQIGTILDRSADASKQLASRARSRLRGASTPPAVDVRAHKQIVDAFLAASRNGDFEALLAVLDPDVVLRADAGNGPFGPSRIVRGAEAVVQQAMLYNSLAKFARPVLVNGLPGLVVVREGEPLSLLSVQVRDGRIVELDIIADPDRLQGLGVATAANDAGAT
jgi:RNA polymerase sigma-70 factor (ECF subfamily)